MECAKNLVKLTIPNQHQKHAPNLLLKYALKQCKRHINNHTKLIDGRGEGQGDARRINNEARKQ